MGAVTFSIDPHLIEALKSTLPFDIFVETGTFRGDTIEVVKDHFNHIYSAELSPQYYEEASKRFSNNPKVTLIHNDAALALALLMPNIQNRPSIFWLDAHWCVANNTSGELSQCPLLSELSSIHRLNDKSVIIIDDARLFLAAPPSPHEIHDWPCFNDINKALHKLSETHQLAVINDCIIFFPPVLENALREFAHHRGTDWLQALDKSRDYDKLLSQLHEKDAVIRQLDNACKEKYKQLNMLSKLRFLPQAVKSRLAFIKKLLKI